MIDVIEVLRHDHEDVRRVLSGLEAGPAASTVAGNSRLRRRKAMVQQLVAIESRHEIIEERYFWPAVREHVPGGGPLADRAIAQGRDARRVLDLLLRTEPGHEDFELLLRRAIAAGRSHMEFEETQAWPQVERALSAQDRGDLGALLERAKRAAPARPHPAIPASPAVLRVTGPLAAAADRIRDALVSRSRVLARQTWVERSFRSTGRRTWRSTPPTARGRPVMMVAGTPAPARASRRYLRLAGPKARTIPWNLAGPAGVTRSRAPRRSSSATGAA